MTTPFPGMDPYVESIWKGFHHRTVTYISDALNPLLPDGLRARLEDRVYLEDLGSEARQYGPDFYVYQETPTAPVGAGGGAAVAGAPTRLARPAYTFRLPPAKEPFVDILDLRSGGRVVTSIELLSPSNKLAGRGRREYRAKQADCRRAGVSLVEIDLVRAGRPVTAAAAGRVPRGLRTLYHASVLDFTDGGSISFYPMPLRDPLPTFAIPLRAGDDPVPLDLQAVVGHSYARGYYLRDLDYSVPLAPPLPPEDAEWAARRVAEWRATLGADH